MYDMSSAPTQEIPQVPADAPTAPRPERRRPRPYPVAPADSADATQEIPIVPASVSPPRQPWREPYAPVTPTAGNGRFARLWHRVRYSPAWVAPAALAVCFAGAAGYVLATDPTDNLGPTTCGFKLITGFDCPGCGGTRALYYLLTFQLPEAAQHHAIAVFAAPFLLYLYLTWSLRRIFPRSRLRLPKFSITPTIAVNFMIAWGIFWVARNLPFAPFTALFV